MVMGLLSIPAMISSVLIDPLPWWLSVPQAVVGVLCFIFGFEFYDQLEAAFNEVAR